MCTIMTSVVSKEFLCEVAMGQQLGTSDMTEKTANLPSDPVSDILKKIAL